MYTFENIVRYSECDENLTLGLPSLLDYFQDTSTFHTESIDRGFAWCSKHGFAWFIAAWNVRIRRLPRFCERIRVSTWSYQKSATLADRAFELTSDTGELLARAGSTWFMWDMAGQRPLLIPEREHSYLQDVPPEGMPVVNRKMRFFGTPRDLAPLPVSEQYLDANHHVNNGQYIALAYALACAQDPGFEVGELEASYRRAAHLGDTLLPRLYARDDGWGVELASSEGPSFAYVRFGSRK